MKAYEGTRCSAKMAFLEEAEKAKIPVLLKMLTFYLLKTKEAMRSGERASCEEN